MTTRKKPDQEETKKKKHIQPTDNKETGEAPLIEENNQEESTTREKSPETSPDNGGDTVAAADKIVTEKKSLEEKLSEMQDKYLRLSAEFDNYRKRTLREKIELSKYAGESLLINILPFMDDFERALKHIVTSENSVALKDGVNLIYVKLTEFLKQNGVKEIESMNSSFDVDLHEAVGTVPVQEEDKKGKVVEVVLKGYYLMDKVIRHSKVIVGE